MEPICQIQYQYFYLNNPRVARRASGRIRMEGSVLSRLGLRSPTMPTQLFHGELRVQPAEVLSRRSSSELSWLEKSAVSTEFQDLNALAVAEELIETRYQEHCARLNLEVLFADGEMGCL
jgi:hypothetical protein